MFVEVGRSRSPHWWRFGPTRSGTSVDGGPVTWSTCAGFYTPLFYLLVVWGEETEPLRAKKQASYHPKP